MVFFATVVPTFDSVVEILIQKVTVQRNGNSSTSPWQFIIVVPTFELMDEILV